jgi:very-short-patch-repair endonuclease
MTKLYNLTSQKTIRRQLRKDEPSTERLLWSKIRNRQLKGFKFRRQYGIGNFIVDFYCPEARLVLEIDGDSHYDEKTRKYDMARQKYLENCKIKIIRFTNKNVMENLEGVLETTANNLPPLTPPYKGGE